MEWPPKSGRTATFPAIDRAACFDLKAARRAILPAQLPLLEALETHLRPATPPATPTGEADP